MDPIVYPSFKPSGTIFFSFTDIFLLLLYFVFFLNIQDSPISDLSESQIAEQILFLRTFTEYCRDPAALQCSFRCCRYDLMADSLMLIRLFDRHASDHARPWRGCGSICMRNDFFFFLII